LNLINPLEFYAFVNETNGIFSFLTKFINQQKPLRRDSQFVDTMELNFFDTGCPVP